MKLVKWLVGIVVALVVIVGVAIVALPHIVPMESLVAEGTAQVEQATGRKLTVGGEPELSIWPEVAIRMDKVAFANADGAPDANMASVEAVRIAVPVMPLLSGAVEVKEFVLVKPDIRLYVDKSGKPNWDFGSGAGGGEAKPESGGGASGGLPEELKEFKLGDVRIEDGRIAYVDAQSGAQEVLEDVDLSVTLPSLNGPLAAEGALTWKGDRLEIDMNMARPLAAMEAGTSALKAALKGAHLDVTFDGEADFANGFALAGQAGVKTPSIKNLAAWAAEPIPVEGDVLGPFEANGALAFGGGRIAFTGADIAIDAIRGKGDFALDTNGDVPAAKAKLALGALDLNPYLPAPAQGGGSGGDAGPGTWSTDPIDLSGLKAVNADLDLTVESLLIQKIKIGASDLKATLQNGVLNMNLAKMALYGGSGTANVKVDGSKKTPSVAKSIKLTGIEALPLLTDAANFDELEGKGDLEMTVAAVGASQAAMVKSADGSGGFVFRDGAVKGFNLGAMVRKVESAFLDSSAGNKQQTDFSELKGTFKIKDGIVTNDDLFMLAPLFRVTGAGKSDMPNRTVDYRVEPKAVASTTGQGGKTDLAGITVPVLITGPWHDLKFAPDLSGALKGLVTDPSKAVDAVKGVAGGAKDLVKDPKGAVDGLLKGITGGGGSAPAAQPDAPAESGGSGGDGNPLKQLKGLFGK